MDLRLASGINYIHRMQALSILGATNITSKMNPIIRNYKLDWHSARRERTGSPPLRHDTTRLESIAPLIKQAVEWGLELKDQADVQGLELLLPPFWEQILSRKYPVDKARALCFSHLYGTVADYSNAILRLIEDSYGNVSFGLLRSVMEAYAKCNCISKSMESRQTICHDYIAISHLADMYNVWYGEASLRQRHNMLFTVEEPKERSKSLSRGEEVELFRLTPAIEEKLKERFKTFPHPLAWVNPNSTTRKSIASIIEDADTTYAKLYHLCNPEVHGNYSGMPRYSLVASNTPVRYIPFTPWGEGTFFEDIRELEFDYRVTEILVRITELAPRFLPQKDSFTQRVITLASSGNRVLEELKGS